MNTRAVRPLLLAVAGLAFAACDVGAPAEAPAPTAGLATYVGNGVTFEHPADWTLQPLNVNTRAFTSLVLVGTAPTITGCQSSPISMSCRTDWNLEPGTVSVLLTAMHRPVGGAVWDREPVDGETKVVVGGVPALFTSSIVPPDGDLSLNWMLSVPGSASGRLVLNAMVRGPGEEALVAQVESLVASFRFDPPVVELPDGPARVAAITRALDSLEESAPAYACYPRAIGATAEAVIRSVPGYHGELRKPLPVKCSIEVEETPVGLWRLTLRISWEAGEDRRSGSVVERVLVNVDGEPVSSSLGPDSGTLPYWP